MEKTEVFIGGLSHETSRARLRRYFEFYGRVIDATIIRDTVAGKPTGYGFVSFAEPGVVDEVLRLQHTLDETTIQVEACSPLESSDRVLPDKIYVGNLEERVEIFHLRKYFVQFGTILNVYISSALKGRKYAFLTFESTDAVRRALKPPEHFLGDNMHPVIVNTAHTEDHKSIPKHPWRHKGMNQTKSSGRGSVQTSGVDGYEQPSSTNHFWDERYRKQQKLFSVCERLFMAGPENTTRCFQHGQVGEDTKPARMRPLQARPTSGSKRVPERGKRFTGFQEGKYPKFLQEVARAHESSENSKDVRYLQLRLHGVTPQSLDQKFREMEIIGDSYSFSSQSTTVGDIQQKNEDAVKTETQSTRHFDQHVHQVAKSFKPPVPVAIEELRSALEREDPVFRGERSKESSRGKDIKKKSKSLQTFRGIAAKTRVVRFRDSDSESQSGVDKRERPKYGSYYDTSNFGDVNVGSKGGITKLAIRDDSSGSSESG